MLCPLAFVNTGTTQSPQFDFDNPVLYAVDEGPWVDGVTSDQGIAIALSDGDGDGLIDAYVSSFGTSIWQGAYYRNAGARGGPAFDFVSPLLASATPYSQYYRGDTTPNISGQRAYVEGGDVNRDGRIDLLVSARGPDLSPPEPEREVHRCRRPRRFRLGPARFLQSDRRLDSLAVAERCRF